MQNKPAIAVVKELLDIYFEKRVSRSAAAMCYFVTLTVFPLLICLNAMLGSMFPTTESFAHFAEGLIPDGTLSILSEYLGYISSNAGSGMLTAGILLMCTSSAAVFRAIHNIMADLHGKPRFRALLSWPISFVFSLVFLAVMYFAILVVLLGNRLLGMLAEHVHFINSSSLWNWARFPLLFLIVFGMLWGLYRITAPKGEKRGLLVGALAGTAAIEIVSALFSVFIGMSARYALVYGSLTSLIILMLWLYLCCTIVIMGNALNVALKKCRHRGNP